MNFTLQILHIRRLFLLASLFLCLATSAQVTEIRSIELDRMIWDEINVYRQTLGRKPVAYFDSTELRQVSFRLTELNATRSTDLFNHTSGEYSFKGYDTECIAAYCHRQVPNKGNSLYDTVLTQQEMQMIAKQIVSQWIASNEHNYLIGNKYVKYSTITSITQVDGNSIQVIVSYHDICPQPSEFDKYY